MVVPPTPTVATCSRNVIGGGGQPRPGEVSLAHNGVLFLDELPEWQRHALEVLREPLESGVVTVSRAARSAEFPARFQLVAAMNPCPCGWAGDASGRCRCNSDAIARYRGRISGPLLDRIDLHVALGRLPSAELRTDRPGSECSADVRRRVEAARARQLERCGQPNGRMTQAETFATCQLGDGDQALLEQAIERLQLSARSAVRILRTARTIADLDGADAIATTHLAEAIGYRTLDRATAPAAPVAANA
jgi:magnesium chelatase family protein